MRRSLGLLLFSVLLAGCPAPECEVAADCDDQNACTEDACFDGVCNHDTAINVDDGNACTIDSCDPDTGVIHEPVNVDDGNACTIDSCDPATGDISHDPIDVDDGNACTIDSCDPDTGVIHVPVDVDDGNACTIDSCDPTTGEVTHTPVDIDDGDACTTDSCDPATGVIHVPVDIDDGNACTIDSCDPATGDISHDPVNVDDGVGCTIDSCDPATGGITHTPDDNACGDVDGATCSVPVCDVVNDCVEVLDDFLCDDGQNCTTTDICDPANGDAVTGCVFTVDDTVCDDGVGCTDDVCAPFAGCSNAANDDNCEEGEFCDPNLDCQGNVDILAQAIITEFQAIGVAGNVGEFIEIHNNGAVEGDITGGFITNGAAQSAVIRAASDPTGALGTRVILGPGDFAFGVPNPADPADIPAGAAFVYGEPGTTFEIADSGDSLTLSNRDSVTLDTVDFTNNFVIDPDVALQPGDFPGFASLSTQLDPNSFDATANDDGNNWCTSFRVANTAGGLNHSCAATAVVINELLYDGALGSDTNDGGKTFLELAGPGGADLSRLRVRGIEGTGSAAGSPQNPNFLIGALQPGARMRVDGLFVIADNTGGDNQTVPDNQEDLLTAFDPENGAADALQLLLEDEAGNIIALVDALAYGVPAVGVDNVEGFPIVEGEATLDANQQISLARDILSTDTDNNLVDFVLDPSPSPGEINQPVITNIFSVTPNDALASAGAAVVEIIGTDFAFNAQVNLAGTDVPTTNCNYAGIPTTITCSVPPSVNGVVRGDVTITNAEDRGGSVGVLADGWTYTGVLNESDLAEEVDFCNLQFPFSITVAAGEPTELIFGQIFEAGLTDATFGQPAAGIVADLGFGPQGSNPTVDPTWIFFESEPNPGFNFDQNNDEYFGTLTISTPGVFQYTFRFSFDDGLHYTYCDIDGAGSNGGLDFSADQLGTLTVN